MDEIRQKKQLKACVTVEKAGLDYINAQKELEREKKEKEREAAVEVGGKSDFLSEMRKIQLKKK